MGLGVNLPHFKVCHYIEMYLYIIKSLKQQN